MKMTITRSLLICLLICATVVVKAQSYHRLAARDFAGIPSAGTNDIAYTNCDVVYTYQVIHHDNNYDITFDVELNMNSNRSYIRLGEVKSREQLQEILRHEQGHYNIAFLLKCEAYAVLSRHRYSANYQREIASLFYGVEAKYQKMNSDYENSTNYMINAQNQDKWNAWFSTQLNNVEIASANSGRTRGY